MKRVLWLIGYRTVMVVPVILGVVTLTFVVARVLAPSPVELLLPPQADQQQRQELIAKFDLDKSLSEQYTSFMGDFLLRGDLGRSIFSGRPVSEDLLMRLPATLELALSAFLLALLLGITVGIIAALRRDRPSDFLLRGVTLMGVAIPSFWLGLLFIVIFFVHLGWLPGPTGRMPIGATYPQGPTGLILIDSAFAGEWSSVATAAHHLVIPIATLTLITMAPISRIVRSAMLEALDSEYIRTARALGIGNRTIHFRLALKNALLPVITIIGTVVGYMVVGAALIELVFEWPGVGLYGLKAVERGDFPALQGFVIWAAVAYVLVFLVVDVLYLAADPRTRGGRK